MYKIRWNLENEIGFIVGVNLFRSVLVSIWVTSLLDEGRTL